MKTKAPKKGLQKLTDSELKINQILSLDKILPSDLDTLGKDEKAKILDILTKKLTETKDVERDKVIKQIDPFMADITRNQIWEHNHAQITYAISTMMQEKGRMPVMTEIAEKTGLSRQTVHKHLKEYHTHPLFLEQAELFRFMTSKVIAKVFHFAVNGDIGAAKLYLNVMGCLNGQTPGGTFIQNQNNFIQINGTVLSQETVKQLNPEQLNSIEAVLKSTIPQTKENP